MKSDISTGPVQAESVVWKTRPLYPTDTDLADAEGFMVKLMKELDGQSIGSTPSNQTRSAGRKEHPFDMETVTKFQVSNIYHATCVHAKVAATVGLGFKTDKVDDELNDLCDNSFAETLSDVAEDYVQVGNGYLEVVRAGDKITALHNVQAHRVFRYIEDAAGVDNHYEVVSNEGGDTKRFARYGDKDDFIRRSQRDGFLQSGGRYETPKSPDDISEIIHFRRSTSLSPWYGFPDWISATAAIELTQCRYQHEYDFYLNRGVPEFIFLLLGKKLAPDDWAVVTDGLKGNIGLGNSHKSMALNIEDPEMTPHLFKLAMEGKDSNPFGEAIDSLSMQIVSAHRTPPLLAGIQIPGKLGATNELPNALMAFQVLCIDQYQRAFKQALGTTLGNHRLNGGLGVRMKDFEFKKVTELIDLGMMDTVGRMRETVPEAKKKGRNLGAGVKD